MYPNNKSYFSKEIKECIVQRKITFKCRDFVSMKDMQIELKHKLRTATSKEREKFESHCLATNTKKLWGLVKVMTNMSPAKRCINE